jgi:hypothetical protein
MSVWKTPHYRDEALQWGIRTIYPDRRDNPFFKSLCDFVVEDFGNFPVPEGVRPGNFKDIFVEDPTIADRVDHNTKLYHDNAISNTIKDLPAATHGVKAVYEISAQILEAAILEKAEKETCKDADFLEEGFKFSYAASSHSKGDVANRWPQVKEALESYWNTAQKAIQDLVRLRGYYKASSNQANNWTKNLPDAVVSPVPNNVAGFFRGNTVYAFPGAIVIKNLFGTKCWILSSSDVERVEKTVRGIVLGQLYLKQYGVLGAVERRRLLTAYTKMVKLIVDVFQNTDDGRHGEICRAFDVAYFHYSARKIVKDDQRAILEQKVKYREEKLEEILPIFRFDSALSMLPPKEAMEVALIYKAFPQPDYDYFGAANRQKAMYDANKAQAKEDGACVGEDFEGILKYHKWMMVVGFHKKHGRCPGFVKPRVAQKNWHNTYPYIDPSKIDFEDIYDIDLAGDYIWRERGSDVMDLVKDKAICPAKIADVKDIRDIRAMQTREKNYLMNVVERDQPVDTRTYKQMLIDEMLDITLRADDKAEAKKHLQRWFFELPSEARMLLSTYEDSITEYGKLVPGFFSGITEKEKIDRMNHITAPVQDALPYAPFEMSFDVKKFSPYLPQTVHERLDEQWAEAFGEEHVKHYSKIMTSGKVHYVKGCIHHEFDKTGADLEGFSGKKLTMYHCAVMGYTVRKLRVQGLIYGKGKFAAFVDDGLLRVDLMKKQYSNNKKLVINTVSRIYAKAALRLSWDKTFCSGHFATFLHEVRSYGRSLTAGYRAALKITNRAEKPDKSLAHDLAVVGSTVSGAIKAGAPLVASHSLYFILFYDAMNRWCKRDSKLKRSEVIRLFFPTHFGGLGMESMTSMCGSLKGPTIVECLGHVKLIGYRYPEVRPAVGKFLSGDFEHPSEHSRLVHPEILVTKGKRLKNDRLTNAIARNLGKKTNSPVLKKLIAASKDSKSTFLERQIKSGAVIPGPLRVKLMESERSEVLRKIARKFINGTTASEFVKARQLRIINYKNADDSEAVVLNMY